MATSRVASHSKSLVVHFIRHRNSVITRIPTQNVVVNCVRHHSKWFRPMLFEINRQIRSILFKYGPEPLKPRSSQENWDYDSELYAFGKRIGEEIDDAVLRQALRHPDVKEPVPEDETGDVGNLVPEEDEASPALSAPDNALLAESGLLFASGYIQAFLSYVYPKLPQDAVSIICDHLLRTELLCHITRHLGITDIVQCKDFPVPDEVLKNAFLAIIGAIYEQNGAERAGAFVRDFVITHLIGEELYDIWDPQDPMGLLVELLEEQGLQPPESRLLREAGKNTYTPLYMVGVYSDRKLLGWGPGETIDVAEKEAAAVSLKNILGIPENRPPLPLDSVKHSHVNRSVCQTLHERMNQKRLQAS